MSLNTPAPGLITFRLTADLTLDAPSLEGFKLAMGVLLLADTAAIGPETTLRGDLTIEQLTRPFPEWVELQADAETRYWPLKVSVEERKAGEAT